VRYDHSLEGEIRALFKQVRAERGRRDILINNVFTVPDQLVFKGRFWEQPIDLWDQISTWAAGVTPWQANAQPRCSSKATTRLTAPPRCSTFSKTVYFRSHAAPIA
jgi:NAD(P)-dependent dehydrogenase (short-subunit alcohol dehydrogenase family)